MRSIKTKMAGAFGILAILLASTNGIAAEGAPKGKGAVIDPDQRLKLTLPPDERHMVLDEMRRFVVAVKQIMDGLATKDYEMVSKAAETMGSGAANEIPDYVVAKLPETFKQLAGKVHTTFDAISLDAADMEDPEHTISQMAALYGHCIACHAIYQVDRER
jgi:hypothetical protein